MLDAIIVSSPVSQGLYKTALKKQGYTGNISCFSDANDAFFYLSKLSPEQKILIICSENMEGKPGTMLLGRDMYTPLSPMLYVFQNIPIRADPYLTKLQKPFSLVDFDEAMKKFVEQKLL